MHRRLAALLPNWARATPRRALARWGRPDTGNVFRSLRSHSTAPRYAFKVTNEGFVCALSRNVGINSSPEGRAKPRTFLKRLPAVRSRLHPFNIEPCQGAVMAWRAGISRAGHGASCLGASLPGRKRLGAALSIKGQAAVEAPVARSEAPIALSAAPPLSHR
jgi:hypothetical protein